MPVIDIIFSNEVVANIVQAIGLLGVSFLYPHIQEARKHKNELFKLNIQNKEKVFVNFSKTISTVLNLQRTYKHFLYHYKCYDLNNAIADKENYRPMVRDLHLKYITLDTTYEAVCSLAKLEFETLSVQIDSLKADMTYYISENCSSTDSENNITPNPKLEPTYTRIEKNYLAILAEMHKAIKALHESQTYCGKISGRRY